MQKDKLDKKTENQMLQTAQQINIDPLAKARIHRHILAEFVTEYKNRSTTRKGIKTNAILFLRFLMLNNQRIMLTTISGVFLVSLGTFTTAKIATKSKPGDTFYSLDRTFENFELAMSSLVGEEQILKTRMKISNERIDELEEIYSNINNSDSSTNGQKEEIEQAIDNYIENIENLKRNLRRLKEKQTDIQKLEKLGESILKDEKKFEEKLISLKDKADANTKPKIEEAINVTVSLENEIMNLIFLNSENYFELPKQVTKKRIESTYKQLQALQESELISAQPSNSNSQYISNIYFEALNLISLSDLNLQDGVLDDAYNKINQALTLINEAKSLITNSINNPNLLNIQNKDGLVDELIEIDSDEEPGVLQNLTNQLLTPPASPAPEEEQPQQEEVIVEEEAEVNPDEVEDIIEEIKKIIPGLGRLLGGNNEEEDN